MGDHNVGKTSSAVPYNVSSKLYAIPCDSARFGSILWNKAGNMTSHLSQQTKQHICVEWSLVSLVHYNNTVVIEIWFTEWLSQQNTICHVLDDSILKITWRQTITITIIQIKEKNVRLEKKTFFFIVMIWHIHPFSSLLDKGWVCARDN